MALWSCRKMCLILGDVLKGWYYNDYNLFPTYWKCTYKNRANVINIKNSQIEIVGMGQSSNQQLKVCLVSWKCFQLQVKDKGWNFNIHYLINKKARSCQVRVGSATQWCHPHSALFCPSALSPSADWLLKLPICDCKAAAAALGITATSEGRGWVGNSQSKLSSCTWLFYQKAESFPEGFRRLWLPPQWLEQSEANPSHRGLEMASE